MKAIHVEQWGGPEVLQLADVAVPDVAAGQVLVRVRAAGINPVDRVYIAGSLENLGRDLSLLALHGRVIVVESRGPVEIQPRELMNCDGDIRAMTGFNVTPAEHASIHAAVVAGLEIGTLRPVVESELPLADAAVAHRAVLQHGAMGKIVLVP